MNRQEAIKYLIKHGLNKEQADMCGTEMLIKMAAEIKQIQERSKIDVLETTK
jgi:hypothetical protein